MLLDTATEELRLRFDSMREERTWLLPPHRTMSSSGIGSPCTSPSRSPLKDIFDVCRPIKEQLEIMQANYGEDSIFNLTVPVLAALEELERYKLLYDEERHRASEDHAMIDRLERELKQKHDEKKRLQEELVESEAANQEELANAYKAINTLKDENKKLKQRIAIELANEAVSDTSNAGSSLSEEEAQAMDNLRNRYAKEHERVREITDQLDIEKRRVNDLRDNIERLLHQNKELIRKNKSLASQTRSVVREKNELLLQFSALDQQLIKTTSELKEARIHSNDLAAESLDSRFAGDDIPKFTEKELQEVFMSKVKLMERVTELELQLDRYKTTSPDDGERLEEFIRPPSTAPSTSPSEQSQKSDKTSASQSSEECLVYGPINREPEEKLNPWKFEKKESGVRKFFSVLFKNVSSASPRRTSTTPDLN